MKKQTLLLFLLALLTLPTFWRMLRPGIFSMHDFHVFRMLEFDKCVKDFQIPCRWAPDAGFGYGEPLFNFYGQLVYIPGQIVRLLGFSILDSAKFLFILSLLGSAFSMFFLARQLWGNIWAGFISAALYLFAPYRAVDVWVRGALPEATAFVLYPAIIYHLTDYFEKEKIRSLLIFGLLMALLAGVHNLSFLMFFLILIPWFLYLTFKTKKTYLWKNMVGVGILAAGLIAFYLLPLALEKKYISLGKTVEGYYYYRNHFTSLHQLLISRFWGYGGSIWGPNDNMSFAVGYPQWVLPLAIGLTLFLKKKGNLIFFLLLDIGWGALFLTHGKSQFIWDALPFFSFIQFPWRWLAIAVFCFSLASGALVHLFKQKQVILVTGFILAMAIWLEAPRFREDIWFNRTDADHFSAQPWEEQIASALYDFWPAFGKSVPSAAAPALPVVADGQATLLLSERRSALVKYQARVESLVAKTELPIVYFPGWRGYLDGKTIDVYPSGALGVITLEIPNGEHQIELRFIDTPIRSVGNFLTLISLGGFTVLFLKKKK